jgi:hypothetical protein
MRDIERLVDRAYNKLCYYTRRSLMTENESYIGTIHEVRRVGFRSDRWAVLGVTFSPQDERRIVVVPVRWVHVVWNQYLMVCVPNSDYTVPLYEEAELPNCTWPIYPVLMCPQGTVIYQTLELALAKRARFF